MNDPKLMLGIINIGIAILIEDANRGLAAFLLGVVPVLLTVSIVLVRTMRFAGKLRN